MHAIRQAAWLGAFGIALTIWSAGCNGPAGSPGSAGEPGKDGASCTVKDNGDGTRTISCEDGTQATVASGKDGIDGKNGADGKDGTSCTVKDNGDGTKTISCDDGTEVTVADGKDGKDGTGGPSGSDKVVPGVNYVAVHDPEAPAYDADCLSCHTDQPDEASLDPDNYPGFHAKKLALPVIPGDTLNQKCLYCHPKVDLSGAQSAGNLRRNVDVSKCGACHSAGEHKFYQGQ
ncbi:MAG: hypothetical protein GXP54_06940 [Deltaproteobacteria bacterium]|nr:hypothetical protein [Deltaproteobacteria bacterium]